jgi:hypothetical protein
MAVGVAGGMVMGVVPVTMGVGCVVWVVWMAGVVEVVGVRVATTGMRPTRRSGIYWLLWTRWMHDNRSSGWMDRCSQVS